MFKRQGEMGILWKVMLLVDNSLLWDYFDGSVYIGFKTYCYLKSISKVVI